MIWSSPACFSQRCTHLCTKQSTKTAYHLLTNGQVKRNNKTILTRLRHHVADHQRDWDLFVQPLSYVYNTQLHRSTNTTEFSLVLSPNPAGPAPFVKDSALSSDTYCPIEPQALQAQLLARIKALHAQVNIRLASAQSRCKWDLDKNIKRTSAFAPKRLVFIKQPPLATSAVRDADKGATTMYNKFMPK